MKKKIIVWALFDSGNGCYKQVAENYKEMEIFSIGLDVLNKNSHFIHLNLAQYEYDYTKKTNAIFETLDKLPHPDLIIASPPCESWSVASAMKNGNACWKQEKIEEGLFKNKSALSKFTIRENKDYDNYQFYYDRQFIKRINGELCTFNLIQIIKRYNPKYYIIENPLSSKIWDYINDVIGFEIPYDNPTKYGNYDDYPVSKPTKFKSNIELGLLNENTKNKMKFTEWSNDYNERSNIPLSLVKAIFDKIVELEVNNVDKEK